MSGLRPAKPGEVRNPRGSSNKQRLTNALIKAIEEKGLDDPFVKVGLQHALKGDFRFWAYIFDRIDGKIPQPVDLTENTIVVERRDRKRKPERPAGGPPPDAGAGEG